MLLDSMPHTCTAYRRKRTVDSSGGFVDSFSTVVFASKECWRMKASDQEVEWWQQRGVDLTHKVYFWEDPGVDEGCVLEFGDGYRCDVKSYADPDASAGLGVVWRVMVQRIGTTT
jgi:hypothetical protein